MRPLSTALLLAGCLGAARPVQAHGNPLADTSWLLVGPTLARTSAPGPNLPMDLGAELSATHVYDMVWLGGYLDFTRDFGRTAWKLTLGPEVGYSFFGIDGGPMLLVDAGGVSTGVAIRGFLTVGFIALYVRGEWLLTHRTGSQTDIGVLLKWPLYSSDDWMAYF